MQTERCARGDAGVAVRAAREAAVDRERVGATVCAVAEGAGLHGPNRPLITVFAPQGQTPKASPIAAHRAACSSSESPGM